MDAKTNTITLHADELEYTSEGLKPPSTIDLEVGVHNKVVIVRPTRVKAVPIGYGSFVVDSAFPTPGVLMLGMRVALQELASDFFGTKDAGVYQFFGHADRSGQEAYNKELSDRRAEATRALFVGDVDAMQAIAREEDWGTTEHQVMLRVLRCDPGSIDGVVGDVTKAATTVFQREYADGVFHRHTTERPRQTSLAEDGALDSTTTDALLEAFVTATSPGLAEERLHPTHPVVGCSEFNRVAREHPAYNRRVSLVVHDPLPAFHDRAPCTLGDHSVCPVDKEDSPSNCLWYRTHVIDAPTDDVVHRHFDLRWLEAGDGRIVLSALTTLPDDSAISFQVFRTKPISSPDDIRDDSLAEARSDILAGVIRYGVAQVVWEPPELFSVHDVDAWLVPVALNDVAARRSAAPRARVPVFRVDGGGTTALSPTPGRELARIPRDPPDTAEPSDVGLTTIDAFGRVFQHGRHEAVRAGPQLHPLYDAEPRIVLARHINRTHTRDGS